MDGKWQRLWSHVKYVFQYIANMKWRVYLCNIITITIIIEILYKPIMKKFYKSKYESGIIEHYDIALLYAIILFWIGIVFPVLSREYPFYNFSRLATIFAIGILIITITLLILLYLSKILN
jgi:hypothetical protein